MTLYSRPEDVCLFVGRCGHEWVGSAVGSYACPVCGDHEGRDHHLVSAVPIVLQLDDWGSLWHLVNKEAGKVYVANLPEEFRESQVVRFPHAPGDKG
jgi:hypothetical protein